jgi:hypothetical protein
MAPQINKVIATDGETDARPCSKPLAGCDFNEKKRKADGNNG